MGVIVDPAVHERNSSGEALARHQWEDRGLSRKGEAGSKIAVITADAVALDLRFARDNIVRLESF